MPKPLPITQCCVCCWQPCPQNNDLPRICQGCFDKLTPAERAARAEAYIQIELLRDIRAKFDVANRNAENDENQLGSIARAFENFGRMLKLPAGKAVELTNQVQAFVRLLHEQAEKAAKRDGDDDEPWRESLRE